MTAIFKLRAKRLSPAITKMFGIPVTHSQALELIAQEEDYSNWDTASACISNKTPADLWDRWAASNPQSPACLNKNHTGHSTVYPLRVWTTHDEDDARKMAEEIMAQERCGNDSVLLAGTILLLTAVLLHVCYWEQHKGSSLSEKEILSKIIDCLNTGKFDSNRHALSWMREAVHDSEGVMGWFDCANKSTKSHPSINTITYFLGMAVDRDLWGMYALALKQSLMASRSWR